jgi:type IV pilus assembly protein PilE
MVVTMAHPERVALPRHRGSRRHGFTLIELMIAVAVVGILAAIAIPSYNQHVVKSRRSDAKAALMDYAARQERYYSINNTYATTAQMTLLGYSTFPINVASGNQAFYLLDHVVTPATPTANATFTATAAPLGNQLTKDTTCGSFTLNSAGVQTPTTAGCW